MLLPELLQAGKRLLEHPRVDLLYPEYLFTLHCVIRASVPLMETAQARAQGMSANDPVSARLAEYLAKHIVEEMHHDEWLLDDLEVLGMDRATVLARPPSTSVASLVGAQYYWILHYHPVALLGYIALLEGYPPTRRLIEGLVERTGHQREAFRTLLAHADLDPHHRDELDEVLDSLPLTEQQSTVLGLSALHSVQVLAAAIDDVVDVSNLGA